MAEKRKRGSKSASLKDNCTATNEEIARIVRESFQYYNVPAPTSDEEIAERIEGYFKQCCETGQIPTVEDMALAIGVVVTTLWKWENNRPNSERGKMIKKAKGILAAMDAKLVSEGKIPQVTYIFRAKNFFGMKDQQEVVVQPSNVIGEQKSIAELEKKYLESTYGTESILSPLEDSVIDLKPEEVKVIDATQKEP